MNPTALTEMVARVISDRYRIDELVGVGAISAVYSAFDSVQQRQVAVKLFDRVLAEDDGFIGDLFEALEQAAVLTHPNIAEILDWGIDGGPYIVTELCEGGSLATMLAAGERLEPSQALVMTLECARALNYGHEQGALNGNLNPRNILFSSDQRVRLTDYGLAKVLADAPAAQSERAIENVRYFSPEQARGRAVGEASDLYSLSLVVSEAVSGRAPQVAETVVGTLMDRAESVAELAPELQGLLPPLERCGRLDPEDRPEAEELAIALLATAETMPRPVGLPLAGMTLGSMAAASSLRVVGGSPAAEPATAEMDPIAGVEPVIIASADDHLATSYDSTVDRDQPADGGVAAVDAGAEGFDGDGLVADDFGAKGSSHDQIAPDEFGADEFGADEFGARDQPADEFMAEEPADDDFDVSALGSLDDIDMFAIDDELQVDVPPAELTLVTDVPEASIPGALENLDVAEPVFATVDEASDELDVPSHSPNRRAARPAYAEVHDDADDRLPWWPLVVLFACVAGAAAAGIYFFAFSDSAQTAQVPNLIGVSFDELADEIAGQEWNVERLDDRIDGSVAGSIVAQSPEPGSELGSGETLTVTVSLGSQMVEIPSDIVGLTVEQAASRLSVVGLNLGSLSEENNEALGAGLVIGLNEPTTQKPTGQGVALRVSSGPEARMVPENVIGMSIGDATSLLVGLRLQAVEEPAYDPDIPAGTVLAAIPDPGQVVPADSAVTLVVSAGPEPVEMPDVVDLPLAEAIEAIRELGLIFVDSVGPPGEPVIGTLPPIGATVDVGTEVTIFLDDPEDDEDEG